MPHIIIEYSANLAELTDIDALVATVHAAALDDGLPALDALRTRAVAREHYRIADGDPAYGFVAVTARIGPRPRAAGRRAVPDPADRHRRRGCDAAATRPSCGHQR